MRKLPDLLSLLESWKSGYISPSAQMAISEAIDTLIAQDEEIIRLHEKVLELEGQLISSKIEIKLAEKKTRKKVSNDTGIA